MKAFLDYVCELGSCKCSGYMMSEFYKYKEIHCVFINYNKSDIFSRLHIITHQQKIGWRTFPDYSNYVKSKIMFRQKLRFL